MPSIGCLHGVFQERCEFHGSCRLSVHQKDHLAVPQAHQIYKPAVLVHGSNGFQL